MARADRTFALIVALALGSSAVLVALLASLMPRLALLATRGAAGASDVAVLVVLLLATLGIGLGLITLGRQLLATLSLIHGLLARRVAPSRRVRALARGLGLDGRIDLVEDPRPFSFCYWFLRPRICVSTGLARRLEADELRAVLLHERYHLRHRDPLRIVVARYFAAGLYVIPVVEDLVEHYALVKEIAADEEAVRATRGLGPLARALYKVLPDADEVSLGLLVPVGSLSVTEARIDRLAEGRAVPLVLRPFSVPLSAGALAGAALLFLTQAGTADLLASVPTGLSAAGFLLAPTSLLFAAAVSGGAQQLRLVTRSVSASPR